MLSSHPLAFLRIPFWILIALDNRNLHFTLQPWHYLIRTVHILSMAAFFGGIGLLDVRLMGWRSAIPLRSVAATTLPWLYGAFAVAMLSGTALFLYDPVQVGSHAYFTSKLGFILLGLVNASLFHNYGYLAALTAETRLPVSARVAGAISIVVWTGVVVCAAWDGEGAPKVLLR